MFRFKNTFLSALVLFVCLICINYYFVKLEYTQLKSQQKNKKIDTLKNFSVILKEAYLKNDASDLDYFLKLTKRARPDILYAYIFDKNGKVVCSTYAKPEKFENIKLNFLFSKKILEDFFIERKFILNKDFKKKHILFKDYFLIKENEKIYEVTYFFTFDEELNYIVKIGFFDKGSVYGKNLFVKIFSNRFKVSLAVFFLGTIFFFLINYKFSSFIYDLKKAIKLLGEEKFDTRLNFSYKGELKELASEFNKMANRLKEIDALKQDFISNVTHELRSPLGAIESYLNFMISEDEEIGIDKNEVFFQSINLTERYEYFVRMRNNTKRLRSFVDDILDVAKIESGTFSLNKKMENIKLLIEEVKNLFLLKIKEKNLKIITEIDGLAECFYFDLEKIKQLFIILLDNAIKFSYPGEAITIKTGYICNGERLAENIHSILIEVKDIGIGIPDDQVDKIFDKFEQVKSVAKNFVQAEKGTGLGLSIAKGIAEMHNGKIWVETIFGKGSVFFVELPVIFVE